MKIFFVTLSLALVNVSALAATPSHWHSLNCVMLSAFPQAELQADLIDFPDTLKNVKVWDYGHGKAYLRVDKASLDRMSVPGAPVYGTSFPLMKSGDSEYFIILPNDLMSTPDSQVSGYVNFETPALQLFHDREERIDDEITVLKAACRIRI